MADFSALKTAIQANIRTNGNEEITGAILQDILLSMVTTMGDGAINALAEALAAEVAARQNAVSGEATTRAEADSQLSGRINSEAQTREAADTQLSNSITAITTRINEGYVYAGIATPSTNPGTPAGKVFYIALQAGTYTNFNSIVVTKGISILKYNGTNWSLEHLFAVDDTPKKCSTSLITSGGVFANIGAFDISEYHKSDSTLATYADLTAALAAIPSDYQEGGMSVKFVQSSDNKYVQYRLMANEWRSGVGNWQGVTNEVNAGSRDLVESGAVSAALAKEKSNRGYWNVSMSLEEPNVYVGTIPDLSELNRWCRFLLQMPESKSYLPTNEASINLNGLGNVPLYYNGVRASATNHWRVNAVLDIYFYNGAFWSTEYKSSLKSYDVYVASYNSSEKDKALADYVAGNDNAGLATIANAIAALPDSGGIVQLAEGEYKSSNLQITKSNVIIRGKGTNTYLNPTNTGNNTIYLADGVENVVLENLKARAVKAADYDKIIITNCVVGDTFVRDNKPSDLDSVPYIFVKPSEGIAGINTAIVSISSTGGVIVLSKGTYEGTAGINLAYSNITIQGAGKSTIIKRTSGNDIFSNTATAINNVVKDLSLTTLKTNRSTTCKFKNIILQNCWINGRYVFEKQWETHIIRVGEGCEFAKLSDAYAFISTSLDLSEESQYEIHIYGHIVETSMLQILKSWVHLYGHDNAVVEVNISGTGTLSGVVFLDNNSNPFYGEHLDIEVHDIRFLRTGDIDNYNIHAVDVYSGYPRFYNCVFENATTSPNNYNEADSISDYDEFRGSRRHGIVISVPEYGADCKLEFHNCKGIGSPYGFKNNRGWYISQGSPKLYDCIGIGGGVGARGYGILCHWGSLPIMYNCIGYGSPYGYREAQGIQCQSLGSPIMFNCVGFAGVGKKYKMEYNSTTGEHTMVALGGAQEDCNGILVRHITEPKLYNCCGYTGNGNGYGMVIEAESKPVVKGGHFGVFDYTFFAGQFAKDSGELYQTVNVFGDDKASVPLNILSVVVQPNGSLLPSLATGTRLVLESTSGIEILNILFDNTISTGVNYTVLNPIKQIPANDNIIIKFTNAGGTAISVEDGTMNLRFKYNYNMTGSYGILLNSSRQAEITEARVESNDVSVVLGTNNFIMKNCDIIGRGGVSIKSLDGTSKSNVPIYDSRFSGTLQNVSSFAEKQLLLDSSNYAL